jgi:hypothetical protein
MRWHLLLPLLSGGVHFRLVVHVESLFVFHLLLFALSKGRYNWEHRDCVNPKEISSLFEIKPFWNNVSEIPSRRVHVTSREENGLDPWVIGNLFFTIPSRILL